MPKVKPAVPQVTPPAIRLQTVPQTEKTHPGVERRLRMWMHRADSGDPDFAWLRPCIVRVGRSVFIDDVLFSDTLSGMRALPPSLSRRS